MRVLTVFLLAPVLAAGGGSPASADTDGPDCGRAIQDFGDAPEGVSLPGGVVAGFPTCLAPGPPGTQEAGCAALSSSPGPTGYVRHLHDGIGNTWLGCYRDAGGDLHGIDGEPDGVFSPGGIGGSGCSGSVAIACVQSDGAARWGQDECRGDGSDAGAFWVLSDPAQPAVLAPCALAVLSVELATCAGAKTVYLNVLIDLNLDGDWNDHLPDCAGCRPEWAVKNRAIHLSGPGCTLTLAQLRTAGTEGESWLRVSVTDVPVDDDYPWAGSANRPGGAYPGGETEDYLVRIAHPTPATAASWGRLKTLYR